MNVNLLVVILWNAAAFGTTVFSLFNLIDARKDRSVLSDLKINHTRTIVADSIVRTETSRFFMGALMLAVGLWSLSRPISPTVSLVGVLFSGALLLVCVLTFYNVYQSFHLRRVLLGDRRATNIEQKVGRLRIDDAKERPGYLAAPE